MPTWLRILFCIFFPPLAVIDKGIGPIILVVILTCFGWLPGVIGALYYNNSPQK